MRKQLAVLVTALMLVGIFAVPAVANTKAKASVTVKASTHLQLSSHVLSTIKSVVTSSKANEGPRAVKKKPSIWFINVFSSNILFRDAQKIFVNSAKKYGYVAHVAGNATINIPQQITYIKLAAASGAKAIIFCDLDQPTYQSAVKAAQKKGIIMLSSESCVDTDSNYVVSTNNSAFGQTAAKALGAQDGGAPQVVVFMTNLTSTNQVLQLKSMESYAAIHYPNLKVLAVEYDNSDATTTASQLTAAVLAYPTMNAVWFLEGGGPPTVPAALAQAGKTPGQIYVLAIDALPATLAAVASGWLSATISQCYFWDSGFVAQLAMAAINGHPVKQRTWLIPTQIVTKASLPYAGCPSSFIPTLPKQYLKFG
jgi:ABC-type sugar transport system substrate-binding protein